MKTIYLLGAGASIGHSHNSYPNINDFFIKANQFNFFKNNQFYNELIYYIEDNLGIEITKKNQKLDIEELLTLLIINEEYNTGMRTLSLSDTTINLIRNLLSRLNDEISIKQSEYNTLSDLLDPSDTIITFNWDILLDNILNRNELLLNINNYKFSQYWNFLNHLSGFKEGTKTHISISKPFTELEYSGETGYYLKLHGSIDWLVCNNKDCRAYGKIFPLIEFRDLTYCAECHEYVENLIIPPVLNKQYRKYPSIRLMWSTALLEVTYATKIVIWGYSLPPTDFYTNWLLRQTNHFLKSIDIINPECIRKTKNKVSWNRVFINKYKNIFKHLGNESKIEYYEFFNDYNDGLTIKKKYSLRE